MVLFATAPPSSNPLLYNSFTLNSAARKTSCPLSEPTDLTLHLHPVPTNMKLPFPTTSLQQLCLQKH